MNIEAIVGVVVGILAAATAIGAAGPVFRSNRTKATLELQAAEIEAERSARIAQENRHKIEVAELRGQVQNMRLEYARAIGREVLKFIKEELAK